MDMQTSKRNTNKVIKMKTVENEIIIRKALLKDFQQLTDLEYSFIVGGSKLLPKFEKLDYKTKQKLKKHVKQTIRERKSIFFIAAINHEIIGFIEGAIQKRQSFYKQKTIGRALNFTVKKRFRGKGTGKKLFQKLSAWFKKRKVAYIELHAIKNKKKLEKMYKKWGLLPVETIFRKPL